MADKFGNPPPSYGNPGMYPNLNQPQPGPQPYPNQPYVPQTQPPPGAQHSPFPVRTECPLCKNEVLTETYSSAGLLAWLLGTGLCLIGCSLGCCLIPCCVDSCRDVVHKCPNCKQQIALFKRL